MSDVRTGMSARQRTGRPVSAQSRDISPLDPTFSSPSVQAAFQTPGPLTASHISLPPCHPATCPAAHRVVLAGGAWAGPPGPEAPAVLRDGVRPCAHQGAGCPQPTLRHQQGRCAAVRRAVGANPRILGRCVRAGCCPQPALRHQQGRWALGLYGGPCEFGFGASSGRGCWCGNLGRGREAG